MKDTAQDVAKDVTQDVAEDALGAAEDGGVKLFIMARFIFQQRNPRPTYACRPPRHAATAAVALFAQLATR